MYSSGAWFRAVDRPVVECIQYVCILVLVGFFNLPLGLVCAHVISDTALSPLFCLYIQVFLLQWSVDIGPAAKSDRGKAI